ncbi:MAG: cell envelope integrity protein TolA, partial [Gammaproteobacteria bacterium]
EAAAKAKAEAEAKAKAEAAAKAKAEAEAKAKAEAEAKARAADSQEAINKAIQAIRLKVNRSWIRPISTKSGLKCRIRVRLMSDGTVIEAEVIASSGDEIFDRSAENAVNKASPLPVPQDKELFAKNFRSFTFTFDPDR